MTWPAISLFFGRPTEDCLFCMNLEERIIAENAAAYAIRNGFPVTGLHTLIIPKRHAKDFFALTEQEILACDNLILEALAEILEQDRTVVGFNIGMNAGEAAGQTMFTVVST